MWHPKASHVHLRSNIRARWKRAQPVLGAMDPRYRSSEGLSIILVSIDVWCYNVIFCTIIYNLYHIYIIKWNLNYTYLHVFLRILMYNCLQKLDPRVSNWTDPRLEAWQFHDLEAKCLWDMDQCFHFSKKWFIQTQLQPILIDLLHVIAFLLFIDAYSMDVMT